MEVKIMAKQRRSNIKEQSDAQDYLEVLILLALIGLLGDNA
jgi:hypothetical protein